MKAKRLRMTQQYEINVWGNKVPKSTLGDLIGGFISIAIATTAIGIATESLIKSGIIDSKSGLNRKENQK